MRAIANATPLISLALSERLELLQNLFDQVLVPTAVYDEAVTNAPGRPGTSVIRRTDWLQITTPSSIPTIEPALLGLDPGENQVLLLAREMSPDWVLIDERLARRVAHSMGFPVKGTLGILLTSALAGLLSRKEALDCMERLVHSGIRIGPRWQAWLRDELDRQ
jgi:predicted nucleic acid-binding protein